MKGMNYVERKLTGFLFTGDWCDNVRHEEVNFKRKSQQIKHICHQRVVHKNTNTRPRRGTVIFNVADSHGVLEL